MKSARFMKKVKKSNNGCWLWTGAKSRYGYFKSCGKSERAHRYSWILFRGDIPDGMFVLHKCDNPLCVNPDHLFLGTQTDNMRDAQTKGRLVRPVCPKESLARGIANGMNTHPGILAGEKNGMSVLSDKQRREIIKLRLQGEMIGSLALRFGVSKSQISRTCRGKATGIRPKKWTARMRTANIAARKLNPSAFSRDVVGSKNPRARLTIEDVERIRSVAIRNASVARGLATEFGVCAGTIIAIWKGRIWKES